METPDSGHQRSDHTTFFRYAEQQGWCARGIATGIDMPRIYGMENVPLGPTWEQVRALVASTDTATRRDLRDRAALLCLPSMVCVVGRCGSFAWTTSTGTVRF